MHAAAMPQGAPCKPWGKPCASFLLCKMCQRAVLACACSSETTTVLLSLNRAVCAAGTMELFYSEAPDAMRSTASALQLLTVALGKCAAHASPIHVEMCWGLR
jgi:hypothetical protein